MEWQKFNTHGESQNHAFEVMCNILFEKWCKREYGEKVSYFTTINGDGGDGGVEAYCVLTSGEIIGVQAKWFQRIIEYSQISQIKNSFLTAIKVRPKLVRYIVCVPHDLTSKRVKKGGGITENTEENRWLEFVASMKKDYPNVNIELWNDTRLCFEIQQKESFGAQKYWFDVNELIEDEIKMSIDKARSSWAKTKYIPDIFSTGYIHSIVENFLGSREITRKRIQSIDKVIEGLSKLLSADEDILELQRNIDDELLQNIRADVQTINEWISTFQRIRAVVIEGNPIFEDILYKPFTLSTDIDKLKKSGVYFSDYFHFHSIEDGLRDIYDNIYECAELISADDDNRLILVGNPGTGKTAGIIAEVVNNYEKRTHLPVLIHARDFNNNDSWQTIISRTLGISCKYDEYELFQTLEIAAQNKRLFNEEDDVVRYDAKCFICVDGIDEAPSVNFWKRMIDEAAAYKFVFPHIRFVFLSRPYVFEPVFEYPNKKLIRRINGSGDVSVKSIFKKYCVYYNIDVSEKKWICNQIKTPLALSLFCELYQGRSVDEIDDTSLIVTELFKKKINKMEQTFRDSGKESSAEYIIRNALIALSSAFLKQVSIERDELVKILGFDIRQRFDDVISFLEAEGFVYSYVKEGDVLSPVATYYSWGMQPAFDYLIAEQIMKSIDDEKPVEIETFREGMLQMLSVLLLEKRGKLIDEINQINLEEWEKFELICYSLVNSSMNTSVKYKEYLKEQMQKSVDSFRKIVNYVVIPCSIIPGHELGGALLDEMLRRFESPAERDIWWSVPGELRKGEDESWYACENVRTDIFDFDEDCGFMDWPVVFVWRLSSVSDADRFDARIKLIEWGMRFPNEFYSLFIYCNDIDDQQILENLYAVAYGICLWSEVPTDFLGKLSKWILVSTFSDIGVEKYRNIVIRYYAKSIVEIAIAQGFQDEEALSKVSLPYKVVTWPEVAKAAIDAERMGGYGPIDYDLSRYVLSDPIESIFFHNHYNTKGYSNEAKKVIERYSRQVDRATLKTDGLIIALAYQFILQCGWNSERFCKYEENKASGVDVGIRGTYWPATHGSRSSVMTVAEKYVWCAKHMIVAFFSDLIPAYNYEDGYNFVRDYCTVDNFVNVYQDYVNLKKHNKNVVELYHMDSLCNMLGITTGTKKEQIIEWVNSEKIPNFEEWIKNNNENVMLYSFSKVLNEKFGIEDDVWVNSGFVCNEKFDELLQKLDEYSEDRITLMNVSDFSTAQQSDCYCTPTEACVVPSRREVSNSIKICEIDVLMAVAECATSHHEETEKTFYLPSAYTRKLLGITYGDGYEYLDAMGKTVCTYSFWGERFESEQEILLVEKRLWKEKVENSKYKPFWIYREIKEPSFKATERYGKDFNYRSDRTFFIWFEGDECKYKELAEDVTPQAKDEKYHSSEIADFLSQYGINLSVEEGEYEILKTDS